MTAEEAIAEKEALLRTDPAYRAAVEAVEAEREALHAEREAAEQPLLRDLAAVGVEVDSVWDLAAREEPCPEAVPVLLDHLGRPGPDDVGEGIAAALGKPEARPHWDELVRAYRAADPATRPSSTDGLAATLARLADRRTMPDVLELLHDASRGESRVLLLRAVTRSRLPDRWEIVRACTADPVLRLEAEHLLHQRDLRARRRS